jgi:formylglycine-generating enzyme required for sulfatase activity
VPKIAISYRRADADVMAGRIRDRLAAHYGEDAVFMDIDDIPYGKDFRVHIREAIVQSDVLLVIVGQRWLGAARGGRRRIDDETDFVRVEVETALSNAVVIIPVRVGAARMPQPAQLPESLKNIAFLNTASVDTGRDFHPHLERLIRAIDQTLSDRAVQSPSTFREEAVAPAGPTKETGLVGTDFAKGPIGRGSDLHGIDSALAMGPLTLRAMRPSGDAGRADLEVFRDAPFAPELVVIPTGEFMMGSLSRERGGFPNERPWHRVTIARRFAIGRYPVTFDEYDQFCSATRRENPADAGWGRKRRPVINVSWQHAKEYVAWLSHETEKAYRLPSEAEWEYACRAGPRRRYSFGDAITPGNANYADSDLGRTSEVGRYPANPWSLHDMHGNVLEWVEDDYHENYQGAPTDGSAWKETPSNPRRWVLLGGSWHFSSRSCRSAYRDGDAASLLDDNIGFRVARTLSKLVKT